MAGVPSYMIEMASAALRNETGRSRHVMDHNTVAERVQKSLCGTIEFPNDVRVSVITGSEDYVATVSFPAGQFEEFIATAPRAGILAGSEACAC